MKGGTFPGWCTAGPHLGKQPDIEVMCGGKNSKQPTHAAIWRQGHLLHFGFHETPDQLNANGKRMLANSIRYIARFTEDRPLGLRRMGPTWPRSRRIIRNTLGYQRWSPKSTAMWFAKPWQQKLLTMDKQGITDWLSKSEGYFYAEANGKINVDDEALALGIRIDKASFLTQSLEALSDPERTEAITAILARHLPEGPGAEGSAQAWRGYVKRNSPYLFYSEGAGYLWLIDPLAKKRKIPSAKLRGAARATDQN